ncbi:hypothetical protein Tco_0213502 [Tanacetum coccineum]
MVNRPKRTDMPVKGHLYELYIIYGRPKIISNYTVDKRRVEQAAAVPLTAVFSDYWAYIATRYLVTQSVGDSLRYRVLLETAGEGVERRIIEDGNSFKPVARTTINADGTSTSTIPGTITAYEKIQKKNDLKARSILMMTLPSEHLLTFNQYKDAKTLFEAIEATFGGNEATKKTQKTLLKQMYENFNASSSESLDSIFTRLQKISMYVVVWRNKPDLGSISFDDLYNNFKIVEQEVKRSVISSLNLSSQNVAFVSTPRSTNDVNTSNVLVSTASSSLSTASITDNTARLSVATIYAFLANQPNGSQVVHEDLEQIHKDDLEEMDLKWQLALLSIKARKFYQRTRKKIIINGSDTAS